MEVEPHINDLLMMLEESSDGRRKNVDRLFNQTCESMAILEPWNHATSKHPEALVIIEGVQKSTVEFVNAMIRSQDVARRGVKISKEMIALWDNMLGGTTKSEELETFIMEMVPPAVDAAQQSEEVRKDFQGVRNGLYTTMNRIPGIVDKIEAEEAREMRKIQSAKAFGESSKIFKACAATLVAVAGVVAAVAFPPAQIFLPMALPLISLVADALERKVNMKIAVREIRVQNCQDALETLSQAASDLAQLDKCIDEFASFWTSVKGLLDHVMGRVEGLRDSQALRMRLKSIRSTWVDIAQSYQDYVVKVQYLCEFASLSRDGGGSKSRSRSSNHTKLIKTNEDGIKTSHGGGFGVGLKGNITEGIRPKSVTVM